MADHQPEESHSDVPIERVNYNIDFPSRQRLPSPNDIDARQGGCIFGLRRRRFFPEALETRDSSDIRSMANTTPGATTTMTAWRAGSGLTDNEFKVAMATLKKQAYAPSSIPQKQTAFMRVVSGTFGTQETANNAEEEKACIICLETFRPGEQVVVTPCSHMFHQGCVAPWVKGHGNCPVCRFVLRNRGKVVEDDDGETPAQAGAY